MKGRQVFDSPIRGQGHCNRIRRALCRAAQIPMKLAIEDAGLARNSI